ncbi:MAG: sulfotransferase family protein [bacterium]|nr:sulfotransferase family protein [bacterium]
MVLEPKCYTSQRRSFIWILIPKNASSTIRSVLEQPHFETRFATCASIPSAMWGSATVFAFVRDPVERVLSAYQEVLLRATLYPTYLAGVDFLSLPEGSTQFDGFLDRLDQGPWDLHVAPQTEVLAGRRVDLWGTVDNLEADLLRILSAIGCPPRAEVKHHRTRADVIANRNRTAPDFARSDLSVSQLDRIKTLYHDDQELYDRVVAEGRGVQ